jgi:hypothetical protein
MIRDSHIFTGPVTIAWTTFIYNGIAVPDSFATILATIAGGLVGVLAPTGGQARSSLVIAAARQRTSDCCRRCSKPDRNSSPPAATGLRGDDRADATPRVGVPWISTNCVAFAGTPLAGGIEQAEECRERSSATPAPTEESWRTPTGRCCAADIP